MLLLLLDLINRLAGQQSLMGLVGRPKRWLSFEPYRVFSISRWQPYSYVVHPASVAVEVLAALDDSKGPWADLALQCALLHDVLEDTPRA